MSASVVVLPDDHEIPEESQVVYLHCHPSFYVTCKGHCFVCLCFMLSIDESLLVVNLASTKLTHPLNI